MLQFKSKMRMRYVDSEFFGNATARDVADKMIPVLGWIGVKNLVQLSMDSPHVNWKIFDMLRKGVLGDVNKSLHNIGSCGLHVMHNAFQDGCKASGWDIEHALSSLYWLFNSDCSLHKDDTKVDVGFVAETSIRQLRSTSKIIGRQVLDIRMETKAFLTTLLAKLLLKAPVNHLLVRNMQCLDPRLMVSKKELCVEEMKGLLRTLVAASQVSA